MGLGNVCSGDEVDYGKEDEMDAEIFFLSRGDVVGS